MVQVKLVYVGLVFPSFGMLCLLQNDTRRNPCLWVNSVIYYLVSSVNVGLVCFRSTSGNFLFLKWIKLSQGALG
jgi:hypothetical protein